MTITPELLAEIKAKAEKTREHEPIHPVFRVLIEEAERRCEQGGKTAAALLKYADTMQADRDARMDHPTTISLISALEEAQRERDAAMKAHNECAEWLKESEAERDAALSNMDATTANAGQINKICADLIIERDALRAEIDKFRARLEIDHCYDIDGNRRELSHADGDSLPDAVECRDATIHEIEGRITELRVERDASQAERDTLRAENVKLREALEAIDAACSEEIRARFGNSQKRTMEELGRGSAVFSLLVIPRNLARTALKETAHATDAPKPGDDK